MVTFCAGNLILAHYQDTVKQYELEFTHTKLTNLSVVTKI